MQNITLTVEAPGLIDDWGNRMDSRNTVVAKSTEEKWRRFKDVKGKLKRLPQAFKVKHDPYTGHARLHILRTIALVSLLTGFATVSGQNLVPNPGFEDHVSCPNSISQTYRLTEWAIPPNHLGTTDFYHRCGTGGGAVPSNNDGNQEPHSGDGYMGLIIANIYYNTSTPAFLGHRREYLQVELDSVLEAGQTYRAECWVSCSDRTNFVSDRFGFHFSDTLLAGSGDPDLIYVIPQVEHSMDLIDDETNWVLVTGTFVAQGGEQFLTLGNFRDTTLTQLVPNTSGGGIHNRAHILVDDVAVYRTAPLGILSATEEPSLEIYPNPATNRLIVEFGEIQDHAILDIVDLAGRILLSDQLIQAKKAVFDLTKLSKGIYYVRIRSNSIFTVQRVVLN